MRWSWSLGRYAGIQVYMHMSFLLIIVWIILMHWMMNAGLMKTLEGVIFTLILFVCVIFHEFGHALTARHFGIRTKDIVLLPIGGVARLEKMPDKPVQELWVAIAGPAVNLGIALILFGFLMTAQIFSRVEEFSFTIRSVAQGDFFERLFFANVFLALFNLIPAFPMDGGRVFRAFMAMRMDYVRATKIAAQFGQIIAVFFAFAGLLFNPFLIIIALFIWLGASKESSDIQLQHVIHGIPVYQAMITDFKTLRADQRLSDAVELILTGSQQDFPVMEGEKVVGILTRVDLINGLSRYGQEVFIRDIMQNNFVTVDPNTMLATAFEQLKNCSCRVIPVYDNNRLVGILTAENIGELVMIQKAIKQSNP